MSSPNHATHGNVPCDGECCVTKADPACLCQCCHVCAAVVPGRELVVAVLDAAGFDCTPVVLAPDPVAPEDTATSVILNQSPPLVWPLTAPLAGRYTTPRPFRTLPSRYFLRCVRREPHPAAAAGSSGGGLQVAQSLESMVVSGSGQIQHWHHKPNWFGSANVPPVAVAAATTATAPAETSAAGGAELAVSAHAQCGRASAAVAEDDRMVGAAGGWAFDEKVRAAAPTAAHRCCAKIPKGGGNAAPALISLRQVAARFDTEAACHIPDESTSQQSQYVASFHEML